MRRSARLLTWLRVMSLDVEPGSFDAAMTIHVGMNIAAKDRVYAGVHRALKPGRIFAV